MERWYAVISAAAWIAWIVLIALIVILPRVVGNLFVVSLTSKLLVAGVIALAVGLTVAAAVISSVLYRREVRAEQEGGDSLGRG
jgi:hypothetical protein